ncbi:MAG TPA: hypothetical protein ENG92_03100 [Thiolapillus brandeum]|uniref:Uncharacterized protein n=1 Tax=Thiolapillus brandeum TaxID=1076588 RepID=A0A831K8S5_9GAMM|nr:hypothetical protein [Thiolapillus brandeum]
MKNTVQVSATFSFKGETHTPAITLDLDQFLDHNRCLEDIYPLLAREGGFGHYSYEYEMLLSAPLVFDQPRGLAKDFLADGKLDLEGLYKAWQQEKLISELTDIARQHMGVKQLQDIPGLRETLLSIHALSKKQTP